MKKNDLPLVVILLIACLAPIGEVYGATKDVPSMLDYKNPKVYIVEDIEINGAHFIDKDAILGIAQFKKGDVVQLPSRITTDTISKLKSQELVEDAQISIKQIKGDRISLVIDITEKPRISECIWKGVSGLRSKQTNDEEVLAIKTNLKKGVLLTEGLLENAKNLIHDYFRKRGYLHAEVSISSSPDPDFPNSMKVKVVIRKNKTAKVHKIYFIGNPKMNPQRLKDKMMEIKERPRSTIARRWVKNALTFRLPRLYKGPVQEKMVKAKAAISSQPFSDASFVRDQQRLIAFYNQRGYRDAHILEKEVWQHNDETVNVGLNIDAGKQYFVRSITWVGNKLYDSEKLTEALGVKPGDVYDLALIEERTGYNLANEGVSSLYVNDGYLFFQVEPVEVAIDDQWVDLEMRITEGKKAYINKVIIKGNEYANEKVIRRELSTLPGEEFSLKKMIRSQRDLLQLELFDPTKLNARPILNPKDGTVDLEYQVKGKFKANVNAGGTIAGKSLGLKLEGGLNNFSLRNVFRKKGWRPLPLGDAQQLSLVLKFSKKASDFSFSFQDPWIGGRRPYAIGTSFHVSRHENFNNWGFGFDLGKKLPWPDYTSFNFGANFERYSYKRYEFLEEDIKIPKGKVNEVSFTKTITRDSTDSPIYPKKGFVVGMQVKFTPPYSAFTKKSYKEMKIAERFRWPEYHQWLFDFYHYFNIIGDLVFNTRAHVGCLGGYSTRAGIGPFGRFLLGGAGGNPFIDSEMLPWNELVSLRGYPDESIPKRPKRNPKESRLKATNYKGGVFFNKIAFELRHPIVLSSLVSVYALGFFEGGNSWVSYDKIDLKDWKKSFGFGLRFFLPMLGQVGFDYGLGLDRKSNKIESEFHFSLRGSKR